MSLKSKDVARILEAMETLKGYVEKIPVQKSCAECGHSTGSGCALAGGKAPPQHVRDSGCSKFVWDGVPF